MAKKDVHYQFSEIMNQALDELAKPTRLVQLAGANTKVSWLENTLAHFLRSSLKGMVRPMQLEKARTPDDVFRLFVMASKGKAAELEVESHEKYIAKTYEQQIQGLDDTQLKALSKAEGLHPQYTDMLQQELKNRKLK